MTNTDLLITITVQGEERTVEATTSGYDADRAFGMGYTYWGRFPTGNKAHPMTGTYHRCAIREDGKVCLIRANGSLQFVGFNAPVGYDQHGTPWLLETTLYTHNRNVGRLVNWLDKVPADMIAKW